MVLAGRGGRRAAASHRELEAQLPAYESVMGDERLCRGGRRVLPYLGTIDSCDSLCHYARRRPPTSHGSPRLSDGGVGNTCGEQQ